VKKLLKLNPEYLIAPGLMVALFGASVLDDIGLLGIGIAFLGTSFAVLGCVIGWINSKK
jgi:hypothetical protein